MDRFLSCIGLGILIIGTLSAEANDIDRVIADITYEKDGDRWIPLDPISPSLRLHRYISGALTSRVP